MANGSTGGRSQQQEQAAMATVDTRAAQAAAAAARLVGATHNGIGMKKVRVNVAAATAKKNFVPTTSATDKCLGWGRCWR